MKFCLWRLKLQVKKDREGGVFLKVYGEPEPVKYHRAFDEPELGEKIRLKSWQVPLKRRGQGIENQRIYFDDFMEFFQNKEGELTIRLSNEHIVRFDSYIYGYEIKPS
ncbi:MAG TPA: hypothetical protein VKP03_00235 [Patescibacteria group bacterium]|nr:hypothetical protein [Patescibacteria group bacterium]